MDDSVRAMWRRYFVSRGEEPDTSGSAIRSWRFADNQADGSIAIIPFQNRMTWMLSFWTGEACCIIRTSQVRGVIQRGLIGIRRARGGG